MPKNSAGRARYRHILRFAAWNLAVTWWFEIVLPAIGLRRLSDRHRDERLTRFARKFRALAVARGGLMIKVGQFMSSRLDVLPPEITKELEDLQDEVPPVEFAAIRVLAEQELGAPLHEVFASIDEEPVAAASLGQVYRVTLSPADAADAGFGAAMVKIQRPGIHEIVAIDLAALRTVGGWVNRVKSVAKRADVPALVEQFAHTCMEEIDYLHEAANAERFAEDFATDARVRVPAIAWERSTRQVLTLEDVSAIKINDTTALRAAGIDPSEVATVFADLMFDQLFDHGFFHADPHPGNLFVAPAAVGGAGNGSVEAGAPPWTIAFVDFGMMGEVPTSLRGALRKLVIAAATRDGKGMVAALVESEVLLPSADTAELERMVTKVFGRFGGMGLAELRELDPKEFQAFASEFSEVALSMPFQFPEDFLLITRAVALMSGLCTSLNPTYNVWDSVEPYAQNLLRAEGSNLIGDVGKQVAQVAGIAWKLPERLDSVLTRLEDGSLPLSVPRLEKLAASVDRTAKRLVGTLIFAALLLGGALVRAEDAGLGNALMIASAVPLLYAVIGPRRKR